MVQTIKVLDLINFEQVHFTRTVELLPGTYTIYVVGQKDHEHTHFFLQVQDSLISLPLPHLCKEVHTQFKLTEPFKLTLNMQPHTLKVCIRKVEKQDFVKPKILTVISMRNCQEYIIRCVQSLENQLLRPSCVYIIDDASTDDSYKVLSNYDTCLNLKIIRHTVSVGPFLSKNLAINSTIGEFDFISLLDSDDYLMHDTYYQLWKDLSYNEEAYVIYPHCVRLKGIEVNLFSPLGESDIKTRACFAGMFAHPKVFQECGYFDCVRYGADGEFNSRLKNMKGQEAILENSEVLYFAELREGSLTSIEKVCLNESNELTEWLSESRVHYSKRFTNTSIPKRCLNFPKDIYESMRIFKSVVFAFDDEILCLESENMRSAEQKKSLYLKVSDKSETEAMFWQLIQYCKENQIHHFSHTLSKWGYIV